MCKWITAAVFAVIGLATVGPLVFLLVKRFRLPKRQEFNGFQSNAEKTQLEASIVSSRMHLLALVLIAVVILVGSALIALEIRRHQPEAAAPLSTSAIEELLQKKLLNPEIQQRQHQQIIDAIQGITGSQDNGAWQSKIDELVLQLSVMQKQLDRHEVAISGKPAAKPDPSNGESYFRGLLIALCATPGALAFFYLLRNMNFLSSGNYRIARAAAVTVGSVAGGATLFHGASFVKTIDSIVKFDVKGGYSGPKIVRGERGPRGERGSRGPEGPPGSTTVLPAAMDCGEGGKRWVGPFDDGKASLAADDATVAGAVDALQKISDGKPDRLTAIILIGSADRRSLKPSTVTLYSSNAGLAQARNKFVKDALEKVFKKNEPPILEFYAGPTKTNSELPYSELAVDRSVRVCVLWNQKP